VYPLYQVLAASLGQSGRLHETAAALKEMECLKPADFERMWRITNPYLNLADLEHLREGLRRADFPNREAHNQAA
jgi:hypothetical protein